MVIDESGYDLSITSDYARSEGGKRAKSPKPHVPGSKFSIIGAIGISGIVATMYVEGSVDLEVFETFVEKFLNPKFKEWKICFDGQRCIS